jgi:uncharacterized protein (TIGR02996 family)
MNFELESLLAAVVTAPDDDAPRLACADWLQQHGDPARAEFIRLQLEVARRWDSPQVRIDECEVTHRYRKIAAWQDGRDDLIPLLESENALFREHGGRWLAELPEAMRDKCEFKRGFPDKIEVTLTDLLRHGGSWLRLLPAPEVHLRQILSDRSDWFWSSQRDPGAGRRVEDLADCALLAGCRRLYLNMNRLTGDDLARLLGSPHFPEVRELSLSSNQIGPGGAWAIADCPRMRHLRKLNLSGAVGAAGVEAIASSPHCANLRELSLYGNQLGDRGVEVLAASPHLLQLESIDLGYNRIGVSGLKALCRSENFRQLTRLGLAANDLGDGGVAVLAESRAFPALRVLDLGDNRITRAGARALAEHADWPHLHELELKRNTDLGADGLRALLSAPTFAGLHRLDLEKCALGDRGVTGLASAVCRLRWLQLENNGIGAAGARTLARSPSLSGLRVLNVRENPIDPAGFQALVESRHLAGLKDLFFEDCPVGVEGIRALLRSPCFSYLHNVEMVRQQLDDDVIRELIQCPALASYTRLLLYDNCLTDGAAVALAGSPSLRNVRKLYLGTNQIGDGGARALAASPYLDNLESLSLSDNPLTVAGWRLLKQRFGDRFDFGSYRTEEDWERRPDPLAEEEEADED